MLWPLLWCCSGTAGAPPPALPTALPLEAWSEHLDLAPDERPPWPNGLKVALPVQPRIMGHTAVLLGGLLQPVDGPEGCSSWPLPPLVDRDGRWTSARALDPIAQRLELRLDPAQGLVHLERVIDTPLSGPTPGFWPADWTLEALVDGVPIELPRDGDVVIWPSAQRLVLAGEGRLPSPNHLDEQGLHLLTADLSSDRQATSTGLAVLGSNFHIEPNRGQRVEGKELVVAGVRFPHHGSRDGVRVLANDAADLAVLDRILALRDEGYAVPRPLWVLPGPRDAYVGQQLVLGPDAWSDPVALRRAMWHLRPMDAALREAFQALEGPAPPVVDPGCFGARSRPELDRSRLLAQVLLRDPDAATASSWSELEARHPWLTAWLEAPRWPRIRRQTDGGTVRFVDTGNTGLDVHIPIVVGDVKRVVPLDQPIEVAPDSQLEVAANARLPALTP